MAQNSDPLYLRASSQNSLIDSKSLTEKSCALFSERSDRFDLKSEIVSLRGNLDGFERAEFIFRSNLFAETRDLCDSTFCFSASILTSANSRCNSGSNLRRLTRPRAGRAADSNGAN